MLPPDCGIGRTGAEGGVRACACLRACVRVCVQVDYLWHSHSLLVVLEGWTVDERVLSLGYSRATWPLPEAQHSACREHKAVIPNAFGTDQACKTTEL